MQGIQSWIGWICAEYRYPQKCGNYIVAYVTKTGRVRVNVRYFDGYSFAKNGEVVAWRELPPPPMVVYNRGKKIPYPHEPR